MHRPLIELCAVLSAINSATAFHSPHVSAIRRNGISQRRIPHSQSLHMPEPVDYSVTQLHLANELHLAQDGLSNCLSSLEVASTSILSTDNIKVAFSVATFLPQIFWLFLILIVSCTLWMLVMHHFCCPLYLH